jgi:hypothetical protein
VSELSHDNKLGLWMCNQLADKPLRKRERIFVTSLMRQVLRNPLTFRLSEKQRDWLGKIWIREGAK